MHLLSVHWPSCNKRITINGPQKPLKIHLFFTESSSPEAKKKAKVYFFYCLPKLCFLCLNLRSLVIPKLLPVRHRLFILAGRREGLRLRRAPPVSAIGKARASFGRPLDQICDGKEARAFYAHGSKRRLFSALLSLQGRTAAASSSRGIVNCTSSFL